jgi:N-acetylglucosamine-6-sulfatase
VVAKHLRVWMFTGLWLISKLVMGQCVTPTLSTLTTTSCTMSLSWTPEPGALQYHVTYRKPGMPWTTVFVSDSSNLTITGLTPSTKYTVKMRAVYPGCFSAYTTPTNKKTTVSPAPVGLQADSTGHHEVWLSWEPVCGADSYTINWRKSSEIDWQTLSGITDPSGMVDSLPANKPYEARVIANCWYGSTAPSAIVSFHTTAYPIPDQPNIILIVTDDSRYDEYRPNGAPDYVELPAIERLANEGVNFAITTVPTPVCTPGRASIYTGLYPHANGAQLNAQAINPGIPTMAEILHDNGYYTAFVGKYGTGLGDPAGYDNWITSSKLTYINPPYRMNGVDTVFPGNLLEVYPQLCLQLLNEAPDDQPFLLTFCHRAPHDSITALPEHADLFAYDTMPFPDNFYEYANNYPSYYASWQLNWHPDTAETIEIKREKYRALKGVDQGVQLLYDWLEYRDQMDQTMIIYTSDNGFMEGEHLLDNKGMALHESLQVPLFIRYPARFSPATITNEIASVVDIMPTVLALAGITDTFGLHGLNLKDLAEGTVHRTEVLHQQTGIQILPDIRSVRSLEYLYSFHSCDNMVEEFFDLTTDPDENINQIYNPDYADIINVYREKLDSLRLAVNDTATLNIQNCHMVTDELRTANQNTALPWLLYPDVAIQLINALGSICLQSHITLEPQETIQIPVAHLPNGTYRLVMVHSNQVYQQQVQILHPYR